jgi:hypothetical protein
MPWPKLRKSILRNKLSLWLKVCKERSKALEDLQLGKLESQKLREKRRCRIILFPLHNRDNKFKGNQEIIAKKTNFFSLPKIEFLKSFKTPKIHTTLSKTGKTDQNPWEPEPQSSQVGLQIKESPSSTTTFTHL